MDASKRQNLIKMPSPKSNLTEALKRLRVLLSTGRSKPSQDLLGSMNSLGFI